jgi:hypothetical protein
MGAVAHRLDPIRIELERAIGRMVKAAVDQFSRGGVSYLGDQHDEIAERVGAGGIRLDDVGEQPARAVAVHRELHRAALHGARAIANWATTVGPREVHRLDGRSWRHLSASNHSDALALPVAGCLKRERAAGDASRSVVPHASTILVESGFGWGFEPTPQPEYRPHPLRTSPDEVDVDCIGRAERASVAAIGPAVARVVGGPGPIEVALGTEELRTLVIESPDEGGRTVDRGIDEIGKGNIAAEVVD